MKEQYAIFRFECNEYIVKYICHGEYVGKGEIEDCATSYYDSTAYDEGKDREEQDGSAIQEGRV